MLEILVARSSLVIAVFLLFASYFDTVLSHGRLEVPAARNACWRHGYKDCEPNYNDLEQNCGGVGQQHVVFGGQCGVCGDSMGSPMPRKHEAGGTFAKGVIVQSYMSGQWIDISIVLSANHLGFMEFKLCAINNNKINPTQECFNQNILEIQGYDLQYPVKADERSISLKIKLPDNLSCSQCVLQWRYRAGNNWGTENGKGGLGLGPQEEFYNCADIEIKSTGIWVQPTTRVIKTTTVPISTTTVAIPTTTAPISTTVPVVASTTVASTTVPVASSTVPVVASSTPAAATSTVPITSTAPVQSSTTPVIQTTTACIKSEFRKCRGIGLWASVEDAPKVCEEFGSTQAKCIKLKSYCACDYDCSSLPRD